MSGISGIVIGGEAATARFENFPARLRVELRTGIGRAALKVLVQAKEQKLSGQVLNVVTGRLRRSINVKITESATNVQGSVGTNVKYARVHEFGFDGIVTVREHLSTSKLGNRFSVRSHQRKMHVPERSFLRSALADMAPQIREEFEAALQRALG